MDATISSSGGKEVSIEFEIRHLQPKEMRRNAIKSLGICWGIMLLTAPLPPIHWITVPGFFLAGIYQFFRKWREKAYFEAATFACPECTAPIPLAPQLLQNPLPFVCPSCRYALKLSWEPINIASS